MNYSVNFYLDKSNVNKQLLEKDEQQSSYQKLAKLRMRIRWHTGAAVSFGLKMQVCADAWNKKTQRCERGSFHGREHNVASWVVNGRLGEMETIAHEVMSHCTESMSVEEVRLRVNQALGRKTNNTVAASRCVANDSDRTLCEWIEVFMHERGVLQSWSSGTYKKYKELNSLFASYAPRTRLNDLNSEWLNGFLLCMESQGLRNVTMAKMIEMMRSFLRWAEEERLHVTTDWHDFQPQLKCIPRKVVFLTWEELMRVMNLDLSNERELDYARDLFCLQCFTSLRYSDVSQLRLSEVKADKIEVVTRKTSASLSIDLNRYARDILDRHKGKHADRAMPQMTVQRANLLLKEIGRRACLNEDIQMVWFVGNKRREEILPKWQRLSTHCGRRTFICCSLAMGIPPEIVMRWTGHSNYQSMKPYIAVADGTRRREMKKWDDWEG